MLGTYRREDVTILLKDITGLVEPMGTKEREARIQSGIHYSEMLPLEYEPSPAYLAAFWDALERYADITARAAASAAQQIWERKGPGTVLVSLSGPGGDLHRRAAEALLPKILWRGRAPLYRFHHPGPGH